MIDLTKKPYSPVGLLTVIGFDQANSVPGKPKWRCECDCGAIVSHLGNSIRKKMVYSCGCVRRPKDQWTREPTYYEKKPYGYATRHLTRILSIPWGRTVVVDPREAA